MADLDVVRKKKSPLPWILLLLLVVAAVVALLVWNNSRDAETADTPATYDTSVSNNAANGR